MAIAALVDRRFRGQGLSSRILAQMKGLAEQFGLGDLLVSECGTVFDVVHKEKLAIDR
jgi:GNAT superfamily N-acetyltransferase